MKNLIVTVLIALVPTIGFAHGDHVHKPDIEKAQAIEVAKKQVDRLITDGKIDVAWKGAEHVGTDKKKNKSTWEWVNTFKNVKGKDATKQTLYVFLTLSGDFVAANFSGK